MAGYTKLFSSIVASTVWNEDNDTRIVWITLLALADKSGIVEGSVPGLAVLARVSVDGCRAAITKLSNPDPDSRSKVKEGRRIEAVDGGWHIVNHDEYRSKLSKEERTEYQRQWQANKRARDRQSDECVQVSTEVDDVDISRVQKQKQSTDAEAEAEAERTLAAPSPSPAVAGKLLQTMWNEQAEAYGLPRCVSLSPKREAHSHKRLAEHDYVYWGSVIDRICASNFCRGQNDRGWVATFDWMIANSDNAIKVLEGKYDDRRTVVDRRSAAPEPEYPEAAPCTHDPVCPNREWHAMKVAQERASHDPV